ncbi:MAG: Gfo/Idh/MocA family oxidoreductase [Verrucomicrobia bacterium]|nr:Gfo/Idh/MocA family oxidoreductase [Verrucomicrobiota bacterium]
MNSPSAIVPVTRRRFLSTTSVAAVGALSASRFAFAQASDTLKIALIGCGGRGSGAAAQALNVPGTKLVAMADAFPDRLQGALKGLIEAKGPQVDVPPDRQFVGFDGYKNAISLADVVILATPPGFRPMQFAEAVKQGKHVFAEKPVATDAPGVRTFLAAAEEAKNKNLKVGIGLQRHHDPGYIETIKRIQDGAIGDVAAMRVYWNDAGVWVNPRKPDQTEMEYQMRNWYYFVWLCGDHIAEQHIHNLDVANWVKGAHPVKARGMGGREVLTDKRYGQIFDHHMVEFTYPDGSICFSQCRHQPGCWTEVNEHAIGTRGTSAVGSNLIKPSVGEVWRYRSEKRVDPYQQEHDDLFAAIRNNTPYNEAFNGAHSTMTSILGRMSTYSGKDVTWDEGIKSELNYFPDELSWNAKMKALPDADGNYEIPVPGVSKAW